MILTTCVTAVLCDSSILYNINRHSMCVLYSTMKQLVCVYRCNAIKSNIIHWLIQQSIPFSLAASLSFRFALLFFYRITVYVPACAWQERLSSSSVWWFFSSLSLALSLSRALLRLHKGTYKWAHVKCRQNFVKLLYCLTWPNVNARNFLSSPSHWMNIGLWILRVYFNATEN